MNILQVDTGNEKFDEAYKNMQVHISTFDNFSAFYKYFKDVVKTDDKEKLNVWLLKVLFIEFRYGRPSIDVPKHDFDVLCEKLGEENRNNVKTWLKNELEKVGGKNV